MIAKRFTTTRRDLQHTKIHILNVDGVNRTHSKSENIHKHYWSDHEETVAQEEIDEFNLANGFKKKSREKRRCGHCCDEIGNRVCTRDTLLLSGDYRITPHSIP